MEDGGEEHQGSIKWCMTLVVRSVLVHSALAARITLHSLPHLLSSLSPFQPPSPPSLPLFLLSPSLAPSYLQQYTANPNVAELGGMVQCRPALVVHQPRRCSSLGRVQDGGDDVLRAVFSGVMQRRPDREEGGARRSGREDQDGGGGERGEGGGRWW
eukprot:767728-Hanusia_phi.AAC.3